MCKGHGLRRGKRNPTLSVFLKYIFNKNMPIIPRLNYESIVLVYRQLRKKYFSQRYQLVMAVIFLVWIIADLFLISKCVWNKNNSVQIPVPLPTDINSNFITQVNECFLPIATIYGYTLRISSGFRTVVEQNRLYNQGRTINGHMVTEAPGGKSLHNFGFAIDVVDRWREYNINWEKLARIGAYCGLEPSDEGDISHFEHRDGLTTADFAAGKRPPPLTLPCAVMGERVKLNQPLTFKDLQNCGVAKF